MRAAKIVSVFGVGLLLAGCATAVNNSNQTVNLIVRGSDSAYCEFKNGEYINKVGFHGTGTTNFERSRKNLTAECWGDDNRYKKFTLSSALAKETALDAGTGLIPGLAYDMFGGGMWVWPDPVIVDFRNIETDPAKPQPKWPNEVLEPINKTADMSDTVTSQALNPAKNVIPTDAPRPPAEAVKYLSSIGKLPVEAKIQDKTIASNASKGKMQPIVSPEDFEKPVTAKPKKIVKKTKPAVVKSAASVTPTAEVKPETPPVTPTEVKPEDANPPAQPITAPAETKAAEPVVVPQPAAPVEPAPAEDTPSAPLLDIPPIGTESKDLGTPSHLKL